MKNRLVLNLAWAPTLASLIACGATPTSGLAQGTSPIASKPPSTLGPAPPPPERAAWYCYTADSDSHCEPTKAQCAWRMRFEARSNPSSQAASQTPSCEEAFGFIWCAPMIDGSCARTEDDCKRRIESQVASDGSIECVAIEAKPNTGYLR